MLRPRRLFKAGVTDHLQLYALGSFIESNQLDDDLDLLGTQTKHVAPHALQTKYWENCTRVTFDPSGFKE
jgi:hypothetical protein